jgi:hypothetical protein
LKIKGKSKADSSVFDELHQTYVNEIIEHKERLPEGYQYFGANNNIENLSLFVKNNPFAASALSNIDGKLAIVGMGDSAAPNSWFKRFVDLLSDDYPRVVATFKSDFEVSLSRNCFLL